MRQRNTLAIVIVCQERERLVAIAIELAGGVETQCYRFQLLDLVLLPLGAHDSLEGLTVRALADFNCGHFFHMSLWLGPASTHLLLKQ